MSAQEFNLWNPWRELDRLQDEVQRAFAGRSTTTAWQGDFPVNVWVNEEGAYVTAPLPGVAKDSLDVSVLGETLTLRGQRTAPKLKEGEAFHRQERAYGAFSRSVQLPFKVDAARVSATYTRGVLELMLPRAEEDKPRRINVRAN